MPPKAVPAGDSVTLSGPKLDALRAVLCQVDFNGTFVPAGEMIGLTPRRKSNTLFRGALELMRLELKEGKVFMVDGNNDDDDAAAATHVKATSNKRKGAPAGGVKGANKKVKAEANTDAEDESVATDDGGSKKGGKVDASASDEDLQD